MFTKESIEKTFEKVGFLLKRNITIYLIGGGAMSLKDLKLATKDIDIVMTSKKDLDEISVAFRKLGYEPPIEIEEEIYLTALAVFMKKDSRVDIFLNEVCKALQFSKLMQERAEIVDKFDKLTVKCASNEDIFLFKSMAVESDRDHDIIDCANLFRRELDWDIIIKECVSQHRKEIKWVFWLFEFICKFENKEGVELPIKKKVFELCKQYWNKKPDGFMEDIPNIEKHIKEKGYRISV